MIHLAWMVTCPLRVVTIHNDGAPTYQAGLRERPRPSAAHFHDPINVGRYAPSAGCDGHNDGGPAAKTAQLSRQPQETQ